MLAGKPATTSWHRGRADRPGPSRLPRRLSSAEAEPSTVFRADIQHGIIAINWEEHKCLPFRSTGLCDPTGGRHRTAPPLADGCPALLSLWPLSLPPACSGWPGGVGASLGATSSPVPLKLAGTALVSVLPLGDDQNGPCVMSLKPSDLAQQRPAKPPPSKSLAIRRAIWPRWRFGQMEGFNVYVLKGTLFCLVNLNLSSSHEVGLGPVTSSLPATEAIGLAKRVVPLCTDLFSAN